MPTLSVQERGVLADSLRRCLKDHYPMSTRHAAAMSSCGYDPKVWSQLAQIGVIGALLPVEAGGFGGGGRDIATVFEVVGEALAAEPLLACLMAGRVLMRAGRDELLSQMIAGDQVVTFASEEPHTRYDLAECALVAERSAPGWRLTGHKAVVPHLEAAQQVVVVARTSGSPGDSTGLSLFLMRPGDDCVRGYPLIDGGRAAELILAGKIISMDSLLGSIECGYEMAEEAIAFGTLALCWEAVGLMEVLKARTLDYLRARRQFGRPIGKLQALRHRMVSLAIEIEQARSAAENAADAIDHQTRTCREKAVSAAKYTIGRVGTLVAQEAIQMHGAIGMTWELPLAHYAKRLIMVGHQLGDEDYHLERYVELLACDHLDLNPKSWGQDAGGMARTPRS